MANQYFDERESKINTALQAVISATMELIDVQDELEASTEEIAFALYDQGSSDVSEALLFLKNLIQAQKSVQTHIELEVERYERV